jgi:hypothetical protein
LLALIFVGTVARHFTGRFGKSRSVSLPVSAQKGDEKDRILDALDFLAGLADKISVLEVRVEVYAEMGELLWAVDRERARQYFRLARAAVDEEQPTVEEKLKFWRSGAAEQELEARRQKMRAKLLEVVAGVDPDLAEEIVQAASKPRARPSEKPHAAAAGRGDDKGTSAAGSQTPAEDADAVRPATDLRLVQADEMLPANPRRAAALAQEAINRQVTLEAVNFLLALRRYDREAADGLFSSTVQRLALQHPTDLLGLALLGLYLNAQDTTGSPSPELARQYVSALSAGLSRAVAQGAQLSPAERQKIGAAYSLASGFVSSMARYGSDVVQVLQSTLAQIGPQLVPAGANPPASSGVPTSTPPPSPGVERVTAVERALAKKDFARARELIEQIPDANLRDLKLAELHQAAARAALEAGDIEQARKEALAVAGKYERVRLLNEIARELIERKELAQASAITNEAYSYIQGQSPSVDKTLALLALAQTMLEVDPPQTFPLVTALVQTLNRVWAGFASDYQAYRALQETQEQAKNLFTALGRVDFDQALSLAHQLDNLNLRVPMGLAVCKGAWEQLASEAKKSDAPASPLPPPARAK